VSVYRYCSYDSRLSSSKKISVTFFKIARTLKVLMWHKMLSYSSILTPGFGVVVPKISTKILLKACIYVDDFCRSGWMF